MSITAPLARDQKGDPFELPDKAVEWQVRIYTGGRPTPYETASGEKLFVPIMSSDDTLREHGCSGPLSLLAVDAQQKPVGAPAGYIDLGAPPGQERPRNGHNGRDSLVDAMVQSQLAMQRTQAEAHRSAALRERAAADSQIATMQVMRDVIADLSAKVRPVDAQTIMKEHSAIQKMLDRQRNDGEVVFEASEPTVAKNGKEPPQWASVAAKAPMIAEFIIPKIPNPAHRDWIRMIADVAAQVASFMGGGVNGAVPPDGVIEGSATVMPATREMPPALTEVIVRMSDPEAEAVHRYACDLNPHAFGVFVMKASAFANVEERVAWVRGRINGADGNGGAAPSNPPPGSVPKHVADVITQTAAELGPEDQQELRRIVDLVQPAELEVLANDLLKFPPAARAGALRRAIAAMREKHGKPNGGGGRSP